jgi:hypothetical protein
MLWKQIKLYAVSALIIGLAGLALYYKAQYPRGVVHTTVDVPAVVRQIQRLSELVTVKYNVQKVIGLEEQKVPFGTEKVLMLVQARVLAGVDLAKLTPARVTATGHALQIQLPAPQILHVYLDDKETKVWDRSLSWWAVWVSPNPDLEQSARRAALLEVRVAAENMGILSNAQANAETLLREFLTNLGHSNLTFTVAGAD